MSTTKCPVCKKSDQIQKISAIRDAGISRGSFVGPTVGVAVVGKKVGVTGGVTSLRGMTITQLAENFPLPEAPKPATGSSGGTSVLIGIGSLILASLICFGGGATNNPSSVLVPAWIVLIVGVGIAISVSNRKKAETLPEDQERFETEYKAWLKHHGAYSRIYFCHRDNICFDPKTGKHTTLVNVTNLIYK